MFRSTKRKKRPTGRAFRTDDDDEDDDNEAPTVTAVVVPRKAAGGAVRPSVVAGGSLRLQKKKKNGRSSGKLVYKNQSNTDDDAIGQEETQEKAKSSSAYSKEALAQLMAEQNTKTNGAKAAAPQTAAAVLEGSEDQKKKETRVQFAALNISMKEDHDDAMDGEDFIALDGTAATSKNSNDVHVLTGDEAMRQSGALPGSLGRGLRPRTDFMEDSDEDARMMHHHQEVADDDGWEARIAHRAGITTTASAKRKTPTSASINNNNNTTLDSIRDSVSQSLRQNQIQQQEIADRIRRRQNELSQNTVLTHHQTQLTTAGQQLDYYQQLRNRLCAWVGAMQEVQPRIQEVLLDGLCTVQGEWAKVGAQVEWEREVMLAVLQEHGLVDQVIMGKGDQQQQPNPPLAVAAAVREVDEFGRDIKSRHVMQRDRKRLRRRRIREERNLGENYLCDHPDLSNDEQERLQERFIALQTATTVVWNELDTNYTVLQHLVDVFRDWYTKYPKEYEQCYAGLSLADLASVFVQSELCGSAAHEDLWSVASTPDRHHHQQQEGRRPGWITTIQMAVSTNLMDAASVDRLLEKAILPLVERLFEQKGINPVSHQQVSALGQLLKDAESIPEVPSDLKSLVKMRQLTEYYMRERLDEMTIPILLPTKMIVATGNEEVDEAVKDATIGQLHRMGTIVSNIVHGLLPIKLDSPGLARLVLDFVSQKFLYVVSSILREPQSLATTELSPVVRLQNLYTVLRPTGWLERPDLMMQTAPLRAAMGAYAGAS